MSNGSGDELDDLLSRHRPRDLAALALCCALGCAACSLSDPLKDHCQTTADCVGGSACVAGVCVANGGQGQGQVSDSGTGDGDASSPRPPGMCSEGSIAACSGVPDGATSCQETICGGRLWRDGAQGVQARIPYRVVDPDSKFSSAYLAAIQAGAAAWVRATGGFVRFEVCAPCAGRFVSIVPGDGDGIAGGGALEQILPMPVPIAADPTAPPPLHRIAHQWGHAIGLDDMYRRRDRDAYARFDPTVWCGSGAPGIPARCALSTIDPPGSPALATGTFGAYDEYSKMNGLASDGVCGASFPEPDSAEPTSADASAVFELYSSYISGWAPFQPVGASVSPDGRRDYQLAPGVDPVGGPTIASPAPPSVEIFVRGTDGSLYGIRNLLTGTEFAGWSDWTPVAAGFDSDPSASFGTPDTLYLAARSSSDETIRLNARVGGAWGDWISLGAPAVGAASAPALTASDTGLPQVFVRGSDGLLYHLACQEATETGFACADGWDALPASPSGAFIGKPSTSWRNFQWLYVTAFTAHGGPQVNGWSQSGGWGVWADLPFDVVAIDAEPSLAASGPGDWHYYAPDTRGVLLDGTRFAGSSTIGGLPSSSPSAVGAIDGSRIDVAALVDDHGHPGVWWKFWGGVSPACNYNAPGTCAQCGCGMTGAPPCDY
jgi:hypothetical protein